MRRLKLDCPFQFIGRGGVLALLQQHASDIEVNVKAAARDGFRPLERGECGFVLPRFETSQSQPVLKFGVAWPTRDGIAAELDGFAQASHLEITQRESTIGLKILWGNLAGAFEIMSGAGVVA